MSIQRNLEMVFYTELDKNFAVTVYDARADLTGAEINAVMDDILSKNIFFTNGGNLTGKNNARLVIREVQDFNML